jgi:hypothetical protein
MKYVRLTWKWIFIMPTYVNMNMKRTQQSYGDGLPSSWIDSNVSLRWKQRKSQELGHVPGLQHFGGG